MPRKPSLLTVCEPVELDERDRAIVTSQIGRELLGACAVVVRDGTGRPVVIRNEPFLYDGTPMPTRYWLVGEDDAHRVAVLESSGGVRVAAETVDTFALDAAHLAYATERDAAIDPEYVGPRPHGGVGGTRTGVKCLHAHYAFFLAGGVDPVGRWVHARLNDAADAS